MRSGASGFAVLPRVAFGATGSVAAMARAFAPVGEMEMRAVAFASAFFVAALLAGLAAFELAAVFIPGDPASQPGERGRN